MTTTELVLRMLQAALLGAGTGVFIALVIPSRWHKHAGQLAGYLDAISLACLSAAIFVMAYATFSH